MPNLWTMPDSYYGETWNDYYVGPSRCRESSDLTESNFQVALRRLGGESDTVLVVSEDHWAGDWVQLIAVHESDEKAVAILTDIEESLEAYPVLDEHDWCEREMKSAHRVWRRCFTETDRIEYIRDNRDQFDFKDWSDLRAVVRGDCFTGWASELLH